MLADHLFQHVSNVLEWYLDSVIPDEVVPSICAAVASAKSGQAPESSLKLPSAVATGDVVPPVDRQKHSGEKNAKYIPIICLKLTFTCTCRCSERD